MLVTTRWSHHPGKRQNSQLRSSAGSTLGANRTEARTEPSTARCCGRRTRTCAGRVRLQDGALARPRAQIWLEPRAPRGDERHPHPGRPQGDPTTCSTAPPPRSWLLWAEGHRHLPRPQLPQITRDDEPLRGSRRQGTCLRPTIGRDHSTGGATPRPDVPQTRTSERRSPNA